MSESSQSDSIARFVSRTKDDPFFVGYSIRAFAAARNLEEARVASFLGCGQESMTRLAMCRQPSVGEESYQQDVEQIAAFVGCDPARLQQLLRETMGIRVLRESNASVRDNVTLLAARDRQDETDGDEPNDQDETKSD